MRACRIDHYCAIVGPAIKWILPIRLPNLESAAAFEVISVVPFPHGPSLRRVCWACTIVIRPPGVPIKNAERRFSATYPEAL